jgi:hypothetical protein
MFNDTRFSVFSFGVFGFEFAGIEGNLKSQ